MNFSKKKPSANDIELSEDSIVVHTLDSDGESYSQEDRTDSAEISTQTKPQKFLARIKSILPHSDDEKQKRAGANIIRFLAIMLILTLIARGTAGATMPKVETVTLQSGNILKSTRASGNVAVADTYDFLAPEGLTIKTIPVTVGEKVTTGTVIATFSPDEVGDTLARAQIALRTLQQKQKESLQHKQKGESETSIAQRNLSEAESNYSAAVNNRISKENAVSSLQAKKDSQGPEPTPITNSDGSTTTPELPSDWVTQEQIDQAKLEVTSAQESEKSSLQARDEAKRSLESAKINDANTKQDDANAAANAAIEAETMRLDIEKQQKEVDALSTIANNDNSLLADTDGTIVSTEKDGTKTDSTTVVASVANATKGYLADVYAEKAVAQKLAVGNDCQVAKTSQSNSSLQDGKIIAIGEVDPSTNTAKITIRLSGQDWKQGESVDINIVQSDQNYNYCLPITAVHEDNSGSFIYKMVESSTVLGIQNVVEKVPVQVLAKNDKTAAVDGSIAPNDAIINTTTKPIKEGDKVRLVQS